jgi:hypothetical protein
MGYGFLQLDDDAVALVRDGNGNRQSVSLGSSKGGALATAEAGVHAIIRLGPMGSVDGVKVNLGFGGRVLRPVFYGRGGSTALNGGTIRLTGDSVIANIAVEQLASVGDPQDNLKNGSGFATDLLLRLDWPTSGFAIEAMVANIGTVTVPDVERRTLNLSVATNNLDTLFQQKTDPTTGVVTYRPILDTLDFRVQDTSDVKVTLPRIVRFTASSWANRILQIDVSATLPVTGDFEAPLAVDIGTTWRFIRTLPLRAGVVLGGSQGIGYTGGFAIEGRTMFLQVGAQSLGGFLRKATGVGGRLELGLFF